MLLKINFEVDMFFETDKEITKEEINQARDGLRELLIKEAPENTKIDILKFNIT